MRTRHTTFMQALLLLFAVAFALPSHAQQLSEGWYQIKRSMSASELEKQMKKLTLSNLEAFFKGLTRNEYLYVGEEITAKQKFLGIEYGQRTYGAKYITWTFEKPINTGDVNTYFYITPVEGETEAYTIRSYNGHYLHSDGTFCVGPETLYLSNAIDIKAEGTKSGLAGVGGKIIANTINAAVGIMSISGYSIGKPSISYVFDPSKLSGGTANIADPGFKLTTSYKEMSWQQSITEKTVETGETAEDGTPIVDTELIFGDYLDGKKSDIGNIGLTLAKDLISGEVDLTDQLSVIRFIMRNFCSDAYTFHKVDLTKVNGGGDDLLGSIAGVIDENSQIELIPYTVKIEGWDGTFKINDARDYIATDLTKNNQLTHTNAAVIIESDATTHKYVGAPIYNGGTLFAAKEKKQVEASDKSSFVDKGDHGCSNVVILPYDYKGGAFGIGANCVQDFSKCISAACVDEQNQIIHVYFTEPGKEWKIGVEKGKFVTRNAPFALYISASEKEGLINKKTYTSEVYYPTAVNDKDVELVKIDGSVIPAHTAVLIKNTSSTSGSHDFKYTVASKENQTIEAPKDNLLHGTCFSFVLPTDVNAYVLKTRDGQQKFYKLNQEDRKLAPWRAYLEYDGYVAESPLRIAGFEEVITGVDSVLAPQSINTIYDLSGRRVSTSNGVNIIGGKKVIK